MLLPLLVLLSASSCDVTDETRGPTDVSAWRAAAWDSELAALTPDRAVERGGLGALPRWANARPLKVSTGDFNESDLAKQTQNPIADLIALTFQNDVNFGVGPGGEAQNVFNIQPVAPGHVSDYWNLITRVILPVIYQPQAFPGAEVDFGLGDTTWTMFFSPKPSSSLLWGVGPVLLLPTATTPNLGARQWGGGLSAVLTKMAGPWVVGGLVTNVWSFEGTVDEFLLQPFVNYNFDRGWYLVSAHIVTADWKAPPGEQWTIPIGGGVGRVFRAGKQPLNVSVQAYSNIQTPTFGADWQLRIQVQLLFPKG